eukprot:5154452-Ditylum_brightwellii.AAC.1
MDEFGTLQLSALTLTQLNTVRLYLGALTLADIVSDDGYHIMDWALTGISNNAFCPTRHGATE